jgi:hypothetical protein
MKIEDVEIEELVELFLYKYRLSVELAFNVELKDENSKFDYDELKDLLDNPVCLGRYSKWVLDDQTKKGYPENYDPKEYNPIDVVIE